MDIEEKTEIARLIVPHLDLTHPRSSNEERFIRRLTRGKPHEFAWGLKQALDWVKGEGFSWRLNKNGLCWTLVHPHIGRDGWSHCELDDGEEWARLRCIGDMLRTAVKYWRRP